MLITILVTLIVSLSLAQPEILVYLYPPSVWTIVATAVYMVGAAALTIATTTPITRRLGRGEFLSSKILRRRNILEAVYRYWLIVGQGGLIACGYGRWASITVGHYGIPLLAKIVLIGPFLVTLIIGWALDYRFHHTMRTSVAHEADPAPTYWSRSQHILYNIRHLLLFTIVPVGVILLVMDVMEIYVLPLAPVEHQAAIHMATSLGAAFTVFMLAPLLITRIWRTRRLEPGPLRTDLEELCGALKLKYRDILVWQSHGVIANAAVMGLIAPVRFILVSDGIVDRLERHHIRAVFAHEGGHITSHHLPYLMLMAIAVMTLCGSAADLAAVLLGLPGLAAMLLMLALIFVIGGLLFGAVSRQFERQSDVIGAWASAPPPDNSAQITHEGAAIFAGALEQIARLNGIEQHKHNWRHGSIAHRVQYILLLGSTGGTRRQIDTTVRRIKIAIILGAVATAAAVILQVRLG
ncbi:MAG: M48 family metallopeptidase [Phycisphaerae bacterium]|nr:M48 family metallopeptidase [Phycisphaerae bacterium]